MNCGYLCLFSNVRAGLRAGFGFGPRRVNLVHFGYICLKTVLQQLERVN